MKIVSVREWQNDRGETLLRHTPPTDDYDVIPARCTTKKLCELREAIDDALATAMVAGATEPKLQGETDESPDEF